MNCFSFNHFPQRQRLNMGSNCVHHSSLSSTPQMSMHTKNWIWIHSRKTDVTGAKGLFCEGMSSQQVPCLSNRCYLQSLCFGTQGKPKCWMLLYPNRRLPNWQQPMMHSYNHRWQPNQSRNGCKKMWGLCCSETKNNFKFLNAKKC